MAAALELVDPPGCRNSIHRVRALGAKELLQALQAESFRLFPSTVEAYRDEVLHLVARLRILNRQIREAEKRLKEKFESHPDRELLESLPGLGKTLTIRVAARPGMRRAAHLEATTLQALAGTAPVTRCSGPRRRGGRMHSGSRTVHMRHACDRELQSAFFQMALGSLRSSRWARAFQAHQRSKDVRAATILRALSNKWVKITAAVLRTRTPYDEEKHIASLLARRVSWAAALAKRVGEVA